MCNNTEIDQIAIADQPSSPRIRTKVLLWDDVSDVAVFRIVQRLRDFHITAEQSLNEFHSLFSKMNLQQALKNQIASAKRTNEPFWLVRRHIDHQRYTVLICPVGEGETHPPHTHHNLISLQIVLEGKIHLREYDRVQRLKNGQLIVKPVSDRILSTGDYFTATDFKNNAHWFCAHNGPAVIFNINLRGFSNSTFDNDIGQPFGREYIDPTIVGVDGLILAEEIDKTEAFKRFENRNLSAFPQKNSFQMMIK